MLDLKKSVSILAGIKNDNNKKIKFDSGNSLIDKTKILTPIGTSNPTGKKFSYVAPQTSKTHDIKHIKNSSSSNLNLPAVKKIK
jgi:hypothetical protein